MLKTQTNVKAKVNTDKFKKEEKYEIFNNCMQEVQRIFKQDKS